MTEPVNEPVSPKAGRNIWAVALVILAIAIVGTIWWGMTHGEASSAWLAIAFLLAIPLGIAFWRWQHYRDRRHVNKRGQYAILPLFLLQDTVIIDSVFTGPSIVDSVIQTERVFGIAFWLMTLGGLVLIIVGWVRKHPDLIDRPDPEGTSRGIWNSHSKYHLLYAMGIAFFVAIFDGPTAGIASAVILGLAVEVAQRFPRDKGGGTIEFMDIFYDVLGAMLGALAATIVRCGIFGASWC